MEIVSETTLTARKEHRCELCNRIIHKGQRYRKQFNKDCGDVWSFKGHEECFELTSIIDFIDYYEGVDCDAFEEAIINYVQEYHQGAEDIIKVALQNRNYYGLVKMILAELKEKGIKHIKLIG